MADHVMIQEVELCSISPVKVDDEVKLALSVRLQPEKFHATNLCISAGQAVRLWRDLCSLLTESEWLENLKDTQPDLYEDYLAVYNERPNPTY